MIVLYCSLGANHRQCDLVPRRRFLYHRPHSPRQETHVLLCDLVLGTALSGCERWAQSFIDAGFVSLHRQCDLRDWELDDPFQTTDDLHLARTQWHSFQGLFAHRHGWFKRFCTADLRTAGARWLQTKDECTNVFVCISMHL